jgi:hypothetical protein
MSRVTCRCGEKLKVPVDSPERIDCPRCGAHIRLRRPRPGIDGETNDGYLRFRCPCGRRLKVSAAARPVAGKCPDCGRVVPVPASVRQPTTTKRSGLSDPEARTVDLDAHDLAQLEEWAARHTANPSHPQSPGSTTGFAAIVPGTGSDADVGVIAPVMPRPSVAKFDTGLRVCPRCKKPVHLSAASCRECGTPVPRQ